jgi:hypothetical protein
MRAVTFWLLTVMIVASVSSAQQPLTPTLKPDQTLYGRFTQERQLKGLTLPLKTEGDFVLSPRLGLIWRSERPIEVVTVITTGGIRRIYNGREVQRIATARAPFFAHFYEMLNDALLGDWSGLRRDFAVQPKGSRRAWRLVLKPLKADDPLAARLASVVLSGGDRIDAIDIIRANGDSDHMAFLDQVLTSAPLSAENARLLEQKWGSR